MREFVIDRNIWLRGEGAGPSRLLRESDGKMCCVGIYLKACGVPDEELLDAHTVFMSILPLEADWLIGDEASTGWLYRTNDDVARTEADREQKITELFAKHGVKVTFIN